jgi:3-polyprenyl-4-hydroxybenzoate decarboxylase
MIDVTIHRKQQNARRKFEARELLDKLKSGPCNDCGVVYHPCQMDFLRTSPGPLISRMLIRSKASIMKEIKNCVLVCANCARMRTYNKQKMRRRDKIE